MKMNDNKPINALERQQPIIATDRWRVQDGKLTKTFSFFQAGHRDKFVADILHYESITSHHAIITVFCDDVKLRVFTQGIDVVTGVDKEYASYADVCFREIVYCNGRESVDIDQHEKSSLYVKPGQTVSYADECFEDDDE